MHDMRRCYIIRADAKAQPGFAIYSLDIHDGKIGWTFTHDQFFRVSMDPVKEKLWLLSGQGDNLLLSLRNGMALHSGRLSLSGYPK